MTTRTLRTSFHHIVFVGGILVSLGVWLLAGASEPAAEVVVETSSLASLTLLQEAPALPAAAYAIFDVATGAVLAGQAVDSVRSIASVTKLPAAATLRTAGELDVPIVLTQADIETYGSAGVLTEGAQFTPRELLYPLLLTSSNDAAAALERTTDDLLGAMTRLTRRAGAYDTSFVDASGLADGNRSTAADLARLTTYLYTTDPTLFTLTALPQYLGASQGWQNNSPVLTQSGYRGGKHGYTEVAGRTIVALFDEMVSGQTVTLGYVILGSTDLAADVTTLRRFVQQHATWE